jgi:hypothetical protein
MPIENDIIRFTDDAFHLLEDVWSPELMEHVDLGGRITNRMLSPNKSETVGLDGVRIHAKTRRAFNVTGGKDPNGEFPSSVPSSGVNIHYRFNNRPENNDFTTIDGSLEFLYSDLVQKAGVYSRTGDKSLIVNFADDLYKDQKEEFDFAQALFRSCRRTMVLGTQSGVAKQDDSEAYATASVTPGVGTGARVVLTNTSIARFKEGQRVIPYAAGVRAYVGALEVRGVNPDDNSIGLWDFENPTTTDYSAVGLGNNVQLVFSGPAGETNYNMGMYGPKEWMSEPVAGETFLHDADTGAAIDRTNREYRFLSPHFIRRGATATTIHPDHFNAMGTALSLSYEDRDGSYVVTMHPRLHDSLRARMGEEAFITVPSVKSSAVRALNIGSEKVFFQHPIFGQIAMLADPMMEEREVWFRRPEDWTTFYPMGPGVKYPHPGDLGMFHFVESTIPGRGKSRRLALHATMTMGDYCYAPKKQGCILNVTA